MPEAEGWTSKDKKWVFRFMIFFAVCCLMQILIIDSDRIRAKDDIEQIRWEITELRQRPLLADHRHTGIYGGVDYDKETKKEEEPLLR